MGSTAESFGCVPFTQEEGEQEILTLVMEEQSGDYAPYLYLYPERTELVHIELPDPSRIPAADPEYSAKGWDVIATPSGQLITSEGQRSFLFYEILLDPKELQYDSGWCVPGRQAQASIESAMADYGFLDHELADFAEFWDPVFPSARFITVYPQLDAYELFIDPAPRSLMSVNFAIAPGCREVAPPVIKPMSRAGSHAIEWGVIILGDLEEPSL